MVDITWKEGHIEVAPPKRPLKITGTRLAAIMGLNVWNSPFKAWCEITRTYKEPFTDTIYTIAGKTIEPKQAEYMKKSYFMTTLKTPEDMFGKDYFQKTFGDFFHDIPIFGGMWDYLLFDDSGKPEAVLEMKTSKRVEDWAEDMPEYYALQAALYAYLVGVDQVYMVASFLEDADYNAPEKFVCNVKNTIVRPFKVSERYPDFHIVIERAKKWWEEHIVKGISPAYDEKRDADILKALRTNSLNPETDISELIADAEALKAELDAHYALVADKEKAYKVATDQIKKLAMQQFRDSDKKVAIKGQTYSWEVSRSSTTKIDKDAMKADGILEKYTTTEDTYRLSPKVIKED